MIVFILLPFKSTSVLCVMSAFIMLKRSKPKVPRIAWGRVLTKDVEEPEGAWTDRFRHERPRRL